MIRWIALLLAALLLTGCRARTESVGILPFYPGAEVTASGEHRGTAFGFGPAVWTRIDLRVRAPYEKVRDFYAGIQPGGWTSSLTNETQKQTGRRYDRYLTDARRREFYAIQVREEPDGTITITLAWARRPGGTATR